MLPLDSEHPGDSFGRSFSPRTSFWDQFGSISLISNVSEDFGVGWRSNSALDPFEVESGTAPEALDAEGD